MFARLWVKQRTLAIRVPKQVNLGPILREPRLGYPQSYPEQMCGKRWTKRVIDFDFFIEKSIQVLFLYDSHSIELADVPFNFYIKG